MVPWLGIESHGGLIVAYVGGVAMHIWTIKGYFETIPTEIEECAKVDGATTWQAFWRVLLPMAVPILMVVFVLAFIGTIIEYPIASVLLREEPNLTLAVGSSTTCWSSATCGATLPLPLCCRAADYAGVSAGAALDCVGPDSRAGSGMNVLSKIWLHRQSIRGGNRGFNHNRGWTLRRALALGYRCWDLWRRPAT